MSEFDPLPASGVYVPPQPNYIVDEPITDHYRAWNYAIGYEFGPGDVPIPEGGNTAVFRIAPQGLTEPVFVTKPEEDATFTVTVMSGNGMLIRCNGEGTVDTIPLEAGMRVVVNPSDIYSYKNMSVDSDLVLHDVALPAFQAGDDVEVTSSRIDGPRPQVSDEYVSCVVGNPEDGFRVIEMPTAFADAMGIALTERLITLETGRPGLKLRTLSTEQDDHAYIEGVDEDREHLSRHGDKTADKYQSVDDAKNSRLNAGNKLRFGIWDSDRFVGSINATPSEDGTSVEVGYWLRKSAEGHGYMTTAVKTLTDYLKNHYQTIFANVHVENEGSMEVLRRAGYAAVRETVETWGPAVVFEPSQS